MIPKRLLVPDRLRRPPKSGWSWVDRRFVREHAARLAREAVLLYFFLAAVADRNGLSFSGDGTLATLLRMTLPALVQARDELLAHDLIAHEVRFTQVLSLPPPGPCCCLTRPGTSREESPPVRDCAASAISVPPATDAIWSTIGCRRNLPSVRVFPGAFPP
jgi:hypothetical protein